MGITPQLSPLAKVILIITMFIGRVGLLTLAFGLSRPHIRGDLVFAEEPVTVG
jgi:trk system potassium uptake protein TrkH